MKRTFLTRRRVAIAAALVFVFAITGFFVLPWIIRPRLEQRLSAELGRRVTIERLKLNPFALSVTLENFAVMEPDGSQRFVGWRRLYVNFEALSSLWGEWVLGEVELEQLEAGIVLQADGRFNFADILSKLAPPAAPVAPVADKPARPVRIGRLSVAQTRVDFSDLSRAQPFNTTVGPLTFVLTEFRTVSDRGAPYRFEAVTESGEKLAWSGTLLAEPFRSVGELAVEGILLPKYAPYYAGLLGADIQAGRLAVRGRYELDLAPERPIMKLHEGAVQLRDLAIVERATATPVIAMSVTATPVIAMPVFDVSGIEVDAVSRSAAVGVISASGGRLRVHRAADGTLNLLTMLAPAAAAPVPVTPTSPAVAAAPADELPAVNIGELVLKDFAIELTDLALPRPANLSLNGIEFSLRNITLAPGAPMPLQLAFAWAPHGVVHLEGTVGLNPVKADLKANIGALEILPLSPYLEQFVNAHVTQGAVTTTLAIQAELAAGQPPRATVSGDLAIERFGLVDSAHNEELAGFRTLSLRGVRATTTPELEASIEEISLAAPYARVLVNPDHSLNLALLATNPAAPATTAAASPPAQQGKAAPAAPKINIAKVTLSEGDYRFTDRSLQPNVTMAVTQFGGTITGLSSTTLGKGEVDLKAVVDGAGPVAITGRLDPFGARRTVDLKIDVKNVDLTPLSPYAGKYAGYELARGKLLLDVKLLVDGKQIDAANVITLQQFTFGNSVQSPDATSLPVRLGVALLKDLDGKIVIDVPVQGNTDDPSFRIGRVVLRVIVNLLTKAAVSPFSLLGAAFGGGGDELAFQEFQPGTVDLQPTEQKKLETMTTALVNRPGLSLDLSGSYDVAADRYALQRSKLADQIRRAVWEQKRQLDSNLPPPDQFVATPEEEAAMIKSLFDQRFPPGTEFGTPLPQPPEVVAPPAPPAGRFKRFTRAITFQARREQRAAQRENERRAAEHTRAIAAATTSGLPLDMMKGRLAEAISVDENELRQLGQARAQRVRDYFITTGGISADRLFLAKEPSTAAGAGKGPRVFLTLQ